MIRFERDGYFDDPQAFAVLINGSLKKETDMKVKLVPHSPSHRAYAGYDFEFDRSLVPKYLPLVFRDWFAGEDEAEIEARILALRQYMGLTFMCGGLRASGNSLALMLVGRGSDGKSALIDVIRGCLPDSSVSLVSEMDPAQLCSSSPTVDLYRAQLYMKYLNVCGDCTAQKWVDTGFLKRLMDHDYITGRRIGQDPFTFRVNAAHIYACNALPTVDDKSWGFFRRWLLIHFPNTISPEHRDPLLAKKLLGHERREIVMWCVSAAIDVLEGKARIVPPNCHHWLLSQWAAGNDSALSFIHDCTVDAGSDKSKWTRAASLYESYASWAAQMVDPRLVKSKHAFGKTLSSIDGVDVCELGKKNVKVVNRIVRSDD